MAKKKKKVAKPSPKILGTGMAAKAATGMVKRNKEMQKQIDKVMKGL